MIPPVRTSVLEMIAIDKAFGDFDVSRQVDLRLYAGEIHGLIGEHGAGKSILVSILAGIHTPDRGRIKRYGRPVTIRRPADAVKYGIALIGHKASLAPDLSILENCMLDMKGGWWLATFLKQTQKKLHHIIKHYGLDISAKTKAAVLTPEGRQQAELARALLRGAEVLIFDEPTTGLTPQGIADLFKCLRMLRDEGKTVVFVSHKCDEIMALCDNISVMRHGKRVITRPVHELNIPDMMNFMVGRRVVTQMIREDVWLGDIVFKAERLTLIDRQGRRRLSDVNFSVKEGEILGITGTPDSGQDVLFDILCGLLKPTSGKLIAGREDITRLSPLERRKRGMAWAPAGSAALVSEFPACQALITGYEHDMRYGVIGLSAQRLDSEARKQMIHFNIKPMKPDLTSQAFSKGAQRSLALARECERNPAIMVIAEPTDGADISSSETIRNRILDMRARGRAIILISSCQDDMTSLADRVLVMGEGGLKDEFESWCRHLTDALKPVPDTQAICE